MITTAGVFLLPSFSPYMWFFFLFKKWFLLTDRINAWKEKTCSCRTHSSFEPQESNERQRGKREKVWKKILRRTHRTRGRRKEVPPETTINQTNVIITWLRPSFLPSLLVVKTFFILLLSNFPLHCSAMFSLYWEWTGDTRVETRNERSQE